LRRKCHHSLRDTKHDIEIRGVYLIPRFVSLVTEKPCVANALTSSAGACRKKNGVMLYHSRTNGIRNATPGQNEDIQYPDQRATAADALLLASESLFRGMNVSFLAPKDCCRVQFAVNRVIFRENIASAIRGFNDKTGAKKRSPSQKAACLGVGIMRQTVLP
jgi:hypothetical protein